MSAKDGAYARPVPSAPKERPSETSDPSNRFKRSDELVAIAPSILRYKGYDQETGLEVTWHEALLSNSGSVDERQSLCAVADRLKTLRHEGLGVLHSYWISPDNTRATFVTESISPKSVLDDFLRDSSAIRRKVIVRWFRPVLEVLRYLHSLSPPIIHGKVDLSSIFVRAASGAVKLAAPLPLPFRGSMGRPEFALAPTTPPEALIGRETPASDIWCFGLAMLMVLTKQPPYEECATPVALAERLRAYAAPASLALVTDPLARQVIAACLQAPERRPPAQELLAYPYFTQADGEAKEKEKKPAGPGMVVLFTAAASKPA